MAVRCKASKFALLLLLSVPAFGQSAAQLSAQTESLAEKVTNPVEPLMRVTAENAYSPSLWNTRGEENQVKSIFVVPFTAFTRKNLARMRVLFDTSAADGTHGLSKLEIFDLLLFERSRGIWAAGITAQLKPESPNQSDRLAPGPAVGVVIKSGKWKYGFFNQNFLSHNLAQTELQPIVAHGFDDKWSAEIGDAQYIYDWKKHRITSIPLSGQLNRILSLAHQDVHLFFRAQYNLKNESGSDKWTLTAGFSLIERQKE